MRHIPPIITNDILLYQGVPFQDRILWISFFENDAMDEQDSLVRLFPRASEILFIQGANNSAILYFCQEFSKEVKKEKVKISKNLGYFEQQLAGNGFFRANQSFLINLRYLKMLSGGTLYLREIGKPIFISPATTRSLKHLLSGI